VPDDLPSRPADRLALWDEGFAEGVQEDLVVSCQLSVLSTNTAPLLSPPCRVIPSVARNLALFCGGGGNQSEIPRYARNDTGRLLYAPSSDD